MANDTQQTLGRRTLLKAMGASAVAIGSGGMTFLSPASAAQPTGGNAGRGTDTVIVTVFLRGAIDGLNFVAPIGDTDYGALRPDIGLVNPVDLDGFFSVERRFFSGTGARALFGDGHLAVVHAAGSPASTRSHFSAMDNMDLALGPSGSPGWLARAVQYAGSPQDLAAFGVGVFPNRSLVGSTGARPVVPSLEAIAQNRVIGEKRRANLLALHSPDPWFGNVTARGFTATDAIVGVEAPERSGYPTSAIGGLADAAAIIKADIGVRAVTLDVGGWDHHTNVDTRLPPMLEDLGTGLAAFWNDLEGGNSNARQRTVVIVTSEFGRTAAQNGAAGTDHGRGNCMLVLGERVDGGKVHLRDGVWPGLNDLYEGQDLRVTTDFRDVFAEVLSAQYGPKTSRLSLPDYTPTPVGLFFQPVISAMTSSVTSRGDYQFSFGWGGDAPPGAVRTRLELIVNGLLVETTSYSRLAKQYHRVYKDGPGQGLDPRNNYSIRVAWERADGSVTGWAAQQVPAWS